MKLTYGLLVFGLAFGAALRAEVVQVTSEPMVETGISSGEIRVFGRVSTLNQWKDSDLAEVMPMDSSPQYTALKANMLEGDGTVLSEEDVVAELGDVLGGQFYHFYSNKSEEYLERQASRSFAPLNASIFEFKKIGSYSGSAEDLRAQLSNGLHMVQRVDPDHSHYEVSDRFARGVLPEVHSGHDQLSQMDDRDIAILSAVRTSEYGCPVMEKTIGLLLRVTGESLPSYQGRKLANLYTMSIYREMSDSELADLEVVFGRVPMFAFSQEVFYAPQVLKDAHHIWAVFSNDQGGVQLATYSVIAASTKAANQALSMALGGVTEVTIYETGAAASSQVAVSVAESVLDSILAPAEQQAEAGGAEDAGKFPIILSRDRVDLTEEQGGSRCYKGLAKGLPWFALDMFKEMVGHP